MELHDFRANVADLWTFGAKFRNSGVIIMELSLPIFKQLAARIRLQPLGGHKAEMKPDSDSEPDSSACPTHGHVFSVLV